MVPELLGRLILGTGKLAMKYVVVPIAVTAATAFVLGGLVERVRRQKAEPNGLHEFQSHLQA